MRENKSYTPLTTHSDIPKHIIIKIQEFFNLETTGIWDELTQAAIKNWQAKNGYDATGQFSIEEINSFISEPVQIPQETLNKLKYHITQITELLRNVDIDLHEASLLLKAHILDLGKD